MDDLDWSLTFGHSSFRIENRLLSKEQSIGKGSQSGSQDQNCAKPRSDLGKCIDIL